MVWCIKKKINRFFQLCPLTDTKYLVLFVARYGIKLNISKNKCKVISLISVIHYKKIKLPLQLHFEPLYIQRGADSTNEHTNMIRYIFIISLIFLHLFLHSEFWFVIWSSKAPTHEKKMFRSFNESFNIAIT